MTNTPWFYPDKVSAASGEIVTLFASSPQSPCTLTVSRIGAKALEVARFENIEIDHHPTPDDADQNGCGWPEVFQFVSGIISSPNIVPRPIFQFGNIVFYIFFRTARKETLSRWHFRAS